MSSHERCDTLFGTPPSTVSRSSSPSGYIPQSSPLSQLSKDFENRLHLPSTGAESEPNANTCTEDVRRTNFNLTRKRRPVTKINKTFLKSRSCDDSPYEVVTPLQRTKRKSDERLDEPQQLARDWENLAHASPPKPVHGPLSMEDLRVEKHDSFSLNIDQPGGRLVPWFRDSKQPEFLSVTSENVVNLIEGQFEVDKYFIIDCRFDYEYEGGHIRGAINVTNYEDLKSIFFDDVKQGRVVVIFHCEYSSRRGPDSLNFLRKLDRIQNHERGGGVDDLLYPEIYLLSGGYEAFYNSCKNYCDPCGYVSMNDIKFKDRCRVETRNARRRKLSKSLSFSGPFGRNQLTSVDQDLTRSLNDIRSANIETEQRQQIQYISPSPSYPMIFEGLGLGNFPQMSDGPLSNSSNDIVFSHRRSPSPKAKLFSDDDSSGSRSISPARNSLHPEPFVMSPVKNAKMRNRNNQGQAEPITSDFKSALPLMPVVKSLQHNSDGIPTSPKPISPKLIHSGYPSHGSLLSAFSQSSPSMPSIPKAMLSEEYETSPKFTYSSSTPTIPSSNPLLSHTYRPPRRVTMETIFPPGDKYHVKTLSPDSIDHPPIFISSHDDPADLMLFANQATTKKYEDQENDAPSSNRASDLENNMDVDIGGRKSFSYRRKSSPGKSKAFHCSVHTATTMQLLSSLAASALRSEETSCNECNETSAQRLMDVERDESSKSLSEVESTEEILIPILRRRSSPNVFGRWTDETDLFLEMGNRTNRAQGEYIPVDHRRLWPLSDDTDNTENSSILYSKNPFAQNTYQYQPKNHSRSRTEMLMNFK